MKIYLENIWQTLCDKFKQFWARISKESDAINSDDDWIV